MPTEAKRRFLALDTGEVSLVDSPANQVEFLVQKNLEDDDMSVKKAEATSSDDAAVERVAVETTTTSDNDVTKALGHVNSIVEKIVKAATPAAAAAPAATETATEAEETAEEVAKAGMSMKGFLKAAGVGDKEMPSALEKLKKMGFDPSQKFPTAQAPLSKTTKAAETTEVSASEVVESPLDTLYSAITKAKQFTPDRVKKLKTIANTLKLLMEEVGMDEVPAVNTPAATGSVPSGISSQTGERDVNVGAAKAADPAPDLAAAITKAFQPVVELVQSLKTKVEEVESVVKARVPSSALPANETETNTKKSQSMWSGLL